MSSRMGKKMIVKIVIPVIFALILYIILIYFSSQWSYIKCLEECNQGNNVPHSLCNYFMVQKLVDHGKCWWSDMTLLN